MAEGVLKFGTQDSSTASLAGAPAFAFNLVNDGRGAVRRRPGIKVPTNLPTGVVDSAGLVGLYHPYDGLTEMLAVGNGAVRNIYRLTPTLADNLTLQIGATDDLAGRGRPTFAESEAMVIIAGGEQPQRVFTAGHPATNPPYLSRRLGGSPPRSTHVVMNSQRAVLNDRDQRDRVAFSAQSAGSNFLGQESWVPGAIVPSLSSAAGDFFHENRPDPVQAIGNTTRELFIFGKTSLEVWGVDELRAFSPVSVREYGCLAPHGIIALDQAFAWGPDHKRRFVVSDGRSFQVISDPIKDVLDALTTVDDAFGYRITLGNIDQLVWTFPTAGVTYSFQIGGGWSQWRGWGGTWKQFAPTCHFKRNDTGEEVVGTADGKLGVLDFGTYDDLGAELRAYATSGHQSWGTDKRKQTERIRLAFARTTLTGTDEAEIQLSYRDDSEEWSAPLRAKFTATDRTPVVEFASLGQYRYRDWRIDFSAAEDLVLVRASEQYTVLDN